MATTEEIIDAVREARSSESNFETIVQELDKAIALAQKENRQTLTEDLQEVANKYAAEYRKSKEIRGTAWPEFENFVSQFERVLMNAEKKD
jgi:hypothetical protein